MGVSCQSWSSKSTAPDARETKWVDWPQDGERRKSPAHAQGEVPESGWGGAHSLLCYPTPARFDCPRPAFRHYPSSRVS